MAGAAAFRVSTGAATGGDGPPTAQGNPSPNGVMPTKCLGYDDGLAGAVALLHAQDSQK